MPRTAITLGLFALTVWGALGVARPASGQSSRGPAPKSEGPKRVVKSNAEWQKLLTREQFLVTRMKVTEPPGSGKYAHYHGKGVFACVCCGAELFDARHKFESGTGWPSFDRPLSPDRIQTAADYSEAEPRVEVLCAVCDAHLGHVFGDGPPTTGLRYCLNSAALKLVKVPIVQATGSGKAAKKKPSGKAKADDSKAKAETDGAAQKPRDSAPAGRPQRVPDRS